MNKGFLFSSNRCVNCGACNAACVLNNGWEIDVRNVYTLNQQHLHALPLINLSLACNHCKNAACLDGCPTGAFSRSSQTGAVILDQNKCIGCRYCQWNCPFNSPKFNHKRKLMEKCDLCKKSGEDLPACATACPTGALTFAEIKERPAEFLPDWFPGKRLEPAIEFSNTQVPDPLRIIPQDLFSKALPVVSKKSITSEWSLVLFSFLAMLSVSRLSASLIHGVFPDIYSLLLILAAGLVSLFHLGKPVRAWRAFFNPLTSPLSREIFLFTAFSFLSLLAYIFMSPAVLLAASLSGFLFLIIIDSVYIRSDKKILFHSGQTFVTSLLLISYFTGHIVPFTFTVIIKTALTSWTLTGKYQAFRFFKIAALFIVWSGIISGYAEPGLGITLIILFAEFIDRILFYLDFSPENIKQLFEKPIKITG